MESGGGGGGGNIVVESLALTQPRRKNAARKNNASFGIKRWRGGLDSMDFNRLVVDIAMQMSRSKAWNPRMEVV